MTLADVSITLYTNPDEKNRLNKTHIIQKAVLTGNFRGDVSITDPVVEVEYSAVTDWKYVNYLYITDFDRYYFINSTKILRTGLMELTCHVDVLMSFKGIQSENVGIYGLQAMISRSANASTSMLPDNLYTPNLPASTQIISPQAGTGWKTSNDMYRDVASNYRYVFQLQGQMMQNGASLFAPWPVQTLITNTDGVQKLLNLISTTTAVSSKTFADFIIRAYALPFNIIDTALTTVKRIDTIDTPGLFSSITLPTTGHYYTPDYNDNLIITKSWAFNILPSSRTVGFENYSPYTMLSLEFPPFGNIELDTRVLFQNLIASGSYTVYVDVDVDLVTGNALLYYRRLNSANAPRFFLASGNVSIPIVLSSSNYNVAKVATGMVAGIASTVGSIATGNPIPAIAGVAGLAASAISAADPNTSKITGETGIIGLPKIIKKTLSVNSIAPSLYGYPILSYDYISSFSGFTKCSEVHIENISCLASEADEIESILKSGFIA